MTALEEKGLAAARSAARAATIGGALIDDLERANELGETLVARSSSPLDGDGAWSGAFASLGGLAPADLPAAVRSCWASLFSPNALGRMQAGPAGTARLGIAVLIQPQLDMRASGWARIVDATVEIAAVHGAPGPLLQGWERGTHYVVKDDAMTSAETGGPLSRAEAIEVATIARRARDELGTDLLEWTATGDRMVVLQLDPSSRESPPHRGRNLPDVLATDPLRRLATILAGRSGPLADRLLVPWAAATPDSWQPIADDRSPIDLLRQAQGLADTLNHRVAQASGLAVGDLADGLAGGDPLVAGLVAGARVDPTAIGQIIGAVEAIAARLVQLGRIGDRGQIWWQSVEWLEATLTSSSPPPPARPVGNRWADVIFGVTARAGDEIAGRSASGGRASGRAAFVPAAGDVESRSLRTGGILVLDRPLISFAPLLWRAAALVCRSGSPAAHLCEVARSLHVPAVVSAHADQKLSGAILAVDGDVGVVWRWQAGVHQP